MISQSGVVLGVVVLHIESQFSRYLFDIKYCFHFFVVSHDKKILNRRRIQPFGGVTGLGLGVFGLVDASLLPTPLFL